MNLDRTTPPGPTRACARPARLPRTAEAALLLLLLLPAALVAIDPVLAADTPPGRWSRTDAPAPETQLTPDQERRLRQLETLGYLAGSQPPPAATGITLHDPLRAYQGFNLYTSGHGPEAILLDMNGNELHRWSCPIERAFPEFRPEPGPPGLQCPEYFRRARLLENGDLLAIYEGIGLIRLDKNSNLLWAYDGVTHHDLDVMPDGSIYVLARKAYINQADPQKSVAMEDFVVHLSPAGKELKRISIIDSFRRSFFEPTMQRLRPSGDLLHTNTIEILDGRLAREIPAFRRGNLLLSHLSLDLISVLDPVHETILWTMTGMWRKQHQPTLCGDSSMVIFDNLGAVNGSRVIEFDPCSQRVIYYYEGTAERPLTTHDCGSVQPLPNGNLLISESNTGRALEVTRDDRVVWEFLNPHRAGDNNEYIAALFEVVRIPPGFPLSWL